MNPTGLAVLIGVVERLKEDGSLALAAAPANVLRVLDVTGLTGRFELIATGEEFIEPAEEHPINGRPIRFTAEAEIALGLLATALPFAESRLAEAERWLRVLQSHGDTKRILSDIGPRDCARALTNVPSAGPSSGSTRHDRDPVQAVTKHARGLAGQRGLNVIGTIELLAAGIDVYGSDFDAVLRAHGTARGAVIRALNEEASCG